KRTSQDCYPLHLKQFGKRRFQPDRIHQQVDADFSEQFELVKLRYPRPRREGADQNSSQHIANDQRLAQKLCRTAAHHSRAEYIGQVSIKAGIDSHPVCPRTASVMQTSTSTVSSILCSTSASP